MSDNQDPLGIADDLAKAQLEPEDSYIDPDEEGSTDAYDEGDEINPELSALEAMAVHDEYVKNYLEKKEAAEIIETLRTEKKIGRASLEGVFSMIPDGEVEKARLTEAPTSANQEILKKIGDEFIKELEQEEDHIHGKNRELNDLILGLIPDIDECFAVINDLRMKFEDLDKAVHDSTLFVKVLSYTPEEKVEPKYVRELGFNEYIQENDVLQDAITGLYNRYNTLVDILAKFEFTVPKAEYSFVDLIVDWKNLLLNIGKLIQDFKALSSNTTEIKNNMFSKAVLAAKVIVETRDYMEENRDTIIGYIDDITVNI